jgi:AcrR family transcriptional regulator
VVSNGEVSADWRAGRRRSARAAIVDAAWDLVRDAGLAALSMRDLATRAGITTPTVYAYFASKNDIYDAMFGEAAAEFAARMEDPYDTEDPTEVLLAGTRRFVRFCTEDVARYQLLFQRTIPGFEPSDESYAHAVTALEDATRRLAAVGVTDPRHVDLWTALMTGLVDQQVSNDPGGDRWARLVEDAVAMFLFHCQRPDHGSSRADPGRRSPPRKGARR